MSKRGLGKGLQALLPGTKDDTSEIGKVIEIPIADIRVNQKQPRTVFDDEKLNELASSIKEHGVVQPIIVRKTGIGIYEIVAGERRWRACRKIGIKNIPAIIKDLDEKETTEIALIENIQREDLNPIEEASAYKTLIDQFGLTQEELSNRVGKSRPFIANTLRLLALPKRLRELVSYGKISAGHARALLSIQKEREQEALAEKIIKQGLSVRQTEKTVQDMVQAKKGKKSYGPVEDPILNEIEQRLKTRFSTKVQIKDRNKKGSIEIDYYGEEELQRLIELLLGDVEL
ncbi:ParB/RepB/Spo0J family partition protein [Phosphitispora fastidiosa]|uniref:ParB/RepB/Spo0J family partition protein n=1 Tax=Phosphitispora fastidiosa TaxID=2837202 RepID=UPI001E431DBE|nr:ParB/RepB/Spo0J family partition protein [Phosphitispora fastidiosa]MBU7007545.1 ParB family chromosome partitioning protein [Phosphitispora fastidiosa]